MPRGVTDNPLCPRSTTPPSPVHLPAKFAQHKKTMNKVYVSKQSVPRHQRRVINQPDDVAKWQQNALKLAPTNHAPLFPSKNKKYYSQSTLTLMRLLTVGGTPLDAMQRYAPMSNRLIRFNSSTVPSHSVTGK